MWPNTPFSFLAVLWCAFCCNDWDLLTKQRTSFRKYSKQKRNRWKQHPIDTVCSAAPPAPKMSDLIDHETAQANATLVDMKQQMTGKNKPSKSKLATCKHFHVWFDDLGAQTFPPFVLRLLLFDAQARFSIMTFVLCSRSRTLWWRSYQSPSARCRRIVLQNTLIHVYQKQRV